MIGARLRRQRRSKIIFK